MNKGSFKKFILCMCVCALMGCSMQSSESIKKQGARVSYELALELQLVHSKEDLIQRSSKIKKKVEKLTKLMMEAKRYAKSHPEDDPMGTFSSTLTSDRLFYELQRVYHIEGAKELLEKTQRDSLDRLDEFDKLQRIQKYKRQIVR